jgi:elongation factor P
MEYLYDDGDPFHFMNTENFEQMHLSREMLGDAVNYLAPQFKVNIIFHEGTPISVDLPATVDLRVVETEPSLKAPPSPTSPSRPSWTGLIVQVPPFISEGERIRVNTADASYQERA